MIEGELINLRPIEVSDAGRYCDWLNDREVTRHLQMRYQMPLLAEEAWLRERASEQVGYGSGGNFAVETKDGTHIGSVGFHYVNPENRKATLGIVIGDKRYWSKGYGTDTMRTLLRFGFEEMNLRRIDLSVDADNARAIACYRKCGFIEEGRLREHRYARGAYGDQLWMGMLRDEFRALQARNERREAG
ncbi:MAG TPA: GNAT family protein [Dehalococcoidia bacterium]|nr:GNAT family protein [Dehalococcoidia bacterium]